MATQPYHRFAFEQRKVIQIGVAHRQKAAQIAFATNVNPPSVSRENKRNRIPDGDGTVDAGSAYGNLKLTHLRGFGN